MNIALKDGRMALRALLRDFRSGELRVLAAALLIAVASMTAVGLVSARVELALERRAGELLAADLAIASGYPLPADYAEQARIQGLKASRIATFPSVILAGERTALVEVKTVELGYPLRGAVQTGEQPFGPAQIVSDIPAPGTAWADPTLFQKMNIALGDEVFLGEISLKISRVIAYEPDRGGDLFSIAPRLMINYADLDSTGLIQPGSRVRYRVLVAGDVENVNAYREWLEPNLGENEHTHGVRDERPALKSALDRGGRFLGLAALVSVMVAGVAIAISAQRFARRHWDNVAIMRCLGASQSRVVRIYLFELLGLFLVAGVAGAIAGFFAQEILSQLLAQMVGAGLPSVSLQPMIPALAGGLITLLGFGLPPIWRLKEVTPLRVLRRDLGPAAGSAWMRYGPAVIAIAALLMWQARELKLAIIVLGGSLVTIAVLAAAAALLVRALGMLRKRVGVSWRFGIANISRRGSASVVQVVALGLGMMVLLVLTLVRGDLLASWRDSLPDDAPNHFLINIQRDELESIEKYLADNGVSDPILHPMVRGRLMSVNSRSVNPDDYAGADAPPPENLVQREYNLSWAQEMQVDNRIVDGQWWGADDVGKRIASVEADVAKRLGIGVGDTLNFTIAGQDISVEVTSLRTVEWDSMRANFFVLFPPGVLDEFPANWMTSLYLAPDQRGMFAGLVREHPSVTVLDIDALMSKVRSIIDHVVSAVEYVFAFTLLAGLLVLYAAIQATQDERTYESALLRTLGAKRSVILKSLLAEFATLGLLSGVLASAAAVLLGAVLAEYLFEFSYRGSYQIWILGAVAGVVGVGIAGLLGARDVLNQPPLQRLRAF